MDGAVEYNPRLAMWRFPDGAIIPRECLRTIYLRGAPHAPVIPQGVIVGSLRAARPHAEQRGWRRDEWFLVNRAESVPGYLPPGCEVITAGRDTSISPAEVARIFDCIDQAFTRWVSSRSDFERLFELDQLRNPKRTEARA